MLGRKISQNLIEQEFKKRTNNEYRIQAIESHGVIECKTGFIITDNECCHSLSNELPMLLLPEGEHRAVEIHIYAKKISDNSSEYFRMQLTAEDFIKNYVCPKIVDLGKEYFRSDYLRHPRIYSNYLLLLKSVDVLNTEV